MKIKIEMLSGRALDWAVAKTEVANVQVIRSEIDGDCHPFEVFGPKTLRMLNYSNNWAQGGPVLERHEVEFVCMRERTPDGRYIPRYRASARKLFRFQNYRSETAVSASGPTHLIAGLRAALLSHHNDNEVDVPEELL